MDLAELLRQAQALQQRVTEQQERLAARTVTAQAGGGMVTATANGRGELVAIAVEPQAVDPRDVPMLQDLIVAAVRSAQAKARELREQELGPLAGLLGGDLGGFPFPK